MLCDQVTQYHVVFGTILGTVDRGIDYDFISESYSDMAA